jgi:putative membrane protein (TIGR04086 family)
MIFAIFTSSGKIPENLMGAVVAICCFVAAAVGSRLVIRRVQEKKMIVGAAQGAFMFVLVFAIGRAASADAAIGTITLATLAASVAGGLLGGCGGRKRKRRIRR